MAYKLNKGEQIHDTMALDVPILPQDHQHQTLVDDLQGSINSYAILSIFSTNYKTIFRLFFVIIVDPAINCSKS